VRGRRGTALDALPAPAAERSARDRLAWRWKGDAVILPGDFGLPLSSTGLRLCLFDSNGLRWSAEVPSGGSCGRNACWKDGASLRYRDPELTPDGIRKMTLLAGKPARARIAVDGAGENLGLPPLDLALPATLRLKREDGSPICWQSTFSGASQRTAEAFEAKTP
jgi:hypothetical protein